MTYSECKAAVFAALQRLEDARALNRSAITKEDYAAAREAIQSAYDAYKAIEAVYARFIPKEA